jgi:hypothetical protein
VCRAERSVDAGTGMTRVAAFALHLEGVSQLTPSHANTSERYGFSAGAS